MRKNLDLIIKGNIITVVNQKPRAEAIGVKDGKIVSVGSVSDVEKGSGKASQVLNLKNKTILPGFIDNHTHPMGAGRNALGVDLSSVTTIGETLAKVKERAATTLPGRWILCPQYNRLRVVEKRLPTLKELDDISKTHPICIQHYDGHFSSLNTAAFQKLGFSAGMEGVITDSRGDFTGLIEDPASGRAVENVTDMSNDAECLEALMAFAQNAVKVGLTTTFTKENLENNLFILKNAEHLLVRVTPVVVCSEKHVLTSVKKEKLEEVINCDYLGDRICVATITDGSVEGRTAALFEPYEDDPTTLGMLYYSDEELYAFVERAHRAGLQISVHAESDRAIDQVLWAYEKALEKYPRKDHRHRIEHFEVPTMKQINKVARLGVTLAMQPMFITDCEGPDLDYYRSLLGKERVKRTHPFRSIIDRGILVSGGSDVPVTNMNPLGGIHACVNHPTKEQRIDVYEAIELFTINGAKTGFEENLKGSIEPGKLADFVVLSDDPFRVPREKIADINVEMTMVGGKIVYQR